MAKVAEVINQIVRVADCTPHPRNYNQHDPSQIADLRDSLHHFGQVRSIVVQANARNNGHKSWLTVAGHGLIEAAKLEGIDKLRADVIPATWKPARVLAYLAADNELARRGNPDQAQLAALVAEVNDKEGAVLARLAAGEELALKQLLAYGSDRVIIDPLAEWQGMPEFENEPKAFRTLYVHFETQEDFDNFSQFIDQKFTDKTRAIWYPEKKEHLHMDKSLVYES